MLEAGYNFERFSLRKDENVCKQRTVYTKKPIYRVERCAARMVFLFTASNDHFVHDI